jgi:hypothetical protein
MAVEENGNGFLRDFDVPAARERDIARANGSGINPCQPVDRPIDRCAIVAKSQTVLPDYEM